MEIPKRYLDLIGQTAKIKGCIFSYSKEIEGEFLVHDVRFGKSTIMNVDTLEEIHPTVNLLVSNSTMKKKQWTKGFPVREIDLRSIS